MPHSEYGDARVYITRSTYEHSPEGVRVAIFLRYYIYMFKWQVNDANPNKCCFYALKPAIGMPTPSPGAYCSRPTYLRVYSSSISRPALPIALPAFMTSSTRSS
jgi:hypothetical protein